MTSHFSTKMLFGFPRTLVSTLTNTRNNVVFLVCKASLLELCTLFDIVPGNAFDTLCSLKRYICKDCQSYESRINRLYTSRVLQQVKNCGTSINSHPLMHPFSTTTFHTFRHPYRTSKRMTTTSTQIAKGKNSLHVTYRLATLPVIFPSWAH